MGLCLEAEGSNIDQDDHPNQGNFCSFPLSLKNNILIVSSYGVIPLLPYNLYFLIY
jgi:hypothetical protein